MADDFAHKYIEEIVNDIIKPMEYEITNRGLTKKQQQKVIKEIMFWLLMFAWSKGEYKKRNEKKDY